METDMDGSQIKKLIKPDFVCQFEANTEDSFRMHAWLIGNVSKARHKVVLTLLVMTSSDSRSP